ncbi:hypothetical protein Tco_0639595 [Tanacetum coccineum]
MGRQTRPQELSILGISSKRPLSKGIAHLSRPRSSLKIFITSSKKETNHYTKPGSGTNPSDDTAQALTTIQTMADHSQKCHDRTTSRNIGSSGSNDGLAALVGCQICEGPHLDKDCPLNEEVKQVEKVRSTEMEVRIKKLQENAEINTRNQNASLKNIKTQIKQLNEELHSRNTKPGQAKVVIVEHEEPCSPKKLKNLHGISFLSDSQEENTNDQLPMKESNLGHFTLPCTIDNF